MAAAIALDELVDLIDDEHAHPLQEGPDVVVWATEHDIERFRRCQQHIGVPGRQPLHIPGAYAQAQAQALMDDQLQAAAQVLCQGPRWHYVKDGLGAARGDQPLQTGGQYRLGFAAAGSGL